MSKLPSGTTEVAISKNHADEWTIEITSLAINDDLEISKTRSLGRIDTWEELRYCVKYWYDKVNRGDALLND